jgi:uncharacterized OB-fold protein
MPYRTVFPQPDTQDWNTKEWWAHMKQHRLVIQRCAKCRTFRHPPSPVCFKCRSFEYEWAPVSGRGVIYTYTIAYHPPSPAMAQAVPYNVVLVELPDADNTRLVGNLLDAKDSEIAVGKPVEVAWDDVNDNVTLPQWRLVKT